VARVIRLYEKKRGHRRTGSARLGRLGELLFFAVLSLLGLAGLGMMFFWLVVPQWQVSHRFIPHTCVVLDTRVRKHPTEDLFRPEVKIEYQVDGKTYVEWTYDIATVRDDPGSYSPDQQEQAEAAARFVVDPERPREYPCWYDPADPHVVVVRRGSKWWTWLAFSVPLSVLLIGAVGLLYTWLAWDKSAERKAAISGRLRPNQVLGTNGASRPRFPFVPDGKEITNSPGTRLRFRLPMATSPGWSLFGLFLAALLWNAIVGGAAVYAATLFSQGRPDWRLNFGLIPFVVIGVVLLAYFIRKLVTTTGVGPTLVEISDHPLVPGGSYRLFVSQSGRLKVQRFSVVLVCEEEAVYRQGTNTRTEVREVYRQQLLAREGFEVGSGVPFEAECPLHIPPGAMHSFRANNNQVRWKVVVAAEADGWPPVVRGFPLVVCPPSEHFEHNVLEYQCTDRL
jgi:hypothetical protein